MILLKELITIVILLIIGSISSCEFWNLPSNLDQDRVPFDTVTVGDLQGCWAMVKFTNISNSQGGSSEYSKYYKISDSLWLLNFDIDSISQKIKSDSGFKYLRNRFSLNAKGNDITFVGDSLTPILLPFSLEWRNVYSFTCGIDKKKDTVRLWYYFGTYQGTQYYFFARCNGNLLL